jgi:hypothetical protein
MDPPFPRLSGNEESTITLTTAAGISTFLDICYPILTALLYQIQIPFTTVFSTGNPHV